VNPWLARLLTRLYPRAWRERYAEEFEELLRNERDLRTLANVVCSALCEHIFPTQGGEMDQSSRAFRFHSWCVRAPWVVFGLAPLLLLAGAYFIACLYLWSVWTIFLPGADSPFGVRSSGPPYGFENLFFQFGKFYYFSAPVLVGWAIGLIATRQKMRAVWPGVGLVLIALMGGTAQIRASRTGVPSGLGHIRMDFFAFGPSIQGFYDGMFQVLLILLLQCHPGSSGVACKAFAPACLADFLK
jgi:hypothetical protein